MIVYKVWIPTFGRVEREREGKAKTELNTFFLDAQPSLWKQPNNKKQISNFYPCKLQTTLVNVIYIGIDVGIHLVPTKVLSEVSKGVLPWNSVVSIFEGFQLSPNVCRVFLCMQCE